MIDSYQFYSRLAHVQDSHMVIMVYQIDITIHF